MPKQQSKRKQKPKPRGRPVQGAERKQKFVVTLEPTVAARLRDLGGANLSRGIALAAAAAAKGA
jgi:hypothetical protein